MRTAVERDRSPARRRHLGVRNSQPGIRQRRIEKSVPGTYLPSIEPPLAEKKTDQTPIGSPPRHRLLRVAASNNSTSPGENLVPPVASYFPSGEEATL